MLKRLNVLLAFALVFSLASCDNDEASVVDVDNFVDASLDSMGKKFKFGKRGCFELVFPVDVLFEDGTTVTAEDQEGLVTAIKTWKEDNPDATERPTLAFPLEIINEEGEVTSIESAEDLKAAAIQCRKDAIGNRPKKDRTPCFDLVFPVSLSYPDGTTESYDDRMSMKQAIRAYKRENGRDAERPTLVFPITVVDEDGNETEVASIEDLKALKEACQE